MTAPKITVEPNGALARLDVALQAFAPVFQANALKRLPELRKDVIATVYVIPGPPQYPIRWASRRQMRAYFATDGFGRGIPTQRVAEPGGVLGAYEVVFEPTQQGGQIIFRNTYENAEYIIGDQQQPFHEDTGWVTMDSVRAENELQADAYLFVVYEDTLREIFE